MHCGYFDTTRKGNHSSETNSGWWAMHPSVMLLSQQLLPVLLPSLWNLCSKWPTRFEKRWLWQISAYDISTVRGSEKVQLCPIGSRPRAFKRALDGVRTLSRSPPKGGSKSHFFRFLNQLPFQSNKVCYKVSLCENFQGQSCSITIVTKHACDGQTDGRTDIIATANTALACVACVAR